MSNNKDYINSYLKEKKDKFSKEALVEELKKVGYEEGKIAEEVERVYNKKDKDFQVVDVKSSRLLNNYFLIFLSLIFIFIWFLFDKLLLENNLIGPFSDDYINQFKILFIIIIYLVVIAIITLNIKKFLIKNKFKKVLIYTVVLILFFFITKGVDNLLTIISLKLNIGNIKKNECINSGGKWGLYGFTRTYRCIYKCPFNRDEDGNCIDRNLVSDPLCYQALGTFHEVGFEYARYADAGPSCFIK